MPDKLKRQDLIINMGEYVAPNENVYKLLTHIKKVIDEHLEYPTIVAIDSAIIRDIVYDVVRDAPRTMLLAVNEGTISAINNVILDKNDDINKLVYGFSWSFSSLSDKRKEKEYNSLSNFLPTLYKYMSTTEFGKKLKELIDKHKKGG